MVDKYLKVDPTTQQNVETSFTTSSVGVGSAGKPVATGSDGLIDPSFLPALEVMSVVASENIGAGNLVNIFNSSGTIKVRKATNTGYATRAMGYVKQSVTTGNPVNVYTDDNVITGLSGLTVGTDYFLGTGGGVIDATAMALVTTSGAIVQFIGVGKTSTELAAKIASTVTIRE